MIDHMKNKVFLPVLSVALLGVTLAGCGQDTANQTTATGTTTTTTQTATDNHDHAPGGAPHAHDAQGNHVETGDAHTHDDSAHKAMMAAWFPGATLVKKTVSLQC
jgi:hypothetical protein